MNLALFRLQVFLEMLLALADQVRNIKDVTEKIKFSITKLKKYRAIFYQHLQIEERELSRAFQT